ncbi:MAG: metalloregulator ArsR/SmtB family transcription factor [Rubrobacteraceae bacterium]
MAKRSLEVIEENGRATETSAAGVGGSEERVDRLVALGRALSDPIRVRMLGMMAEAAAEGRGCCGLPNLGVPTSVENTGDSGICVCEFEDIFSMGQSKVSYHIRKLKDAGLVREERRGRWNFYSLDEGTVRKLLRETGEHLGVFSPTNALAVQSLESGNDD